MLVLIFVLFYGLIHHYLKVFQKVVKTMHKL